MCCCLRLFFSPHRCCVSTCRSSWNQHLTIWFPPVSPLVLVGPVSAGQSGCLCGWSFPEYHFCNFTGITFERCRTWLKATSQNQLGEMFQLLIQVLFAVCSRASWLLETLSSPFVLCVTDLWSEIGLDWGSRRNCSGLRVNTRQFIKHPEKSQHSRSFTLLLRVSCCSGHKGLAVNVCSF